MELTNTQLENITATQNVLTSAYQLALAITELEDAMQYPMDSARDITSSIEDQSLNRNAIDPQTMDAK